MSTWPPPTSTPLTAKATKTVPASLACPSMQNASVAPMQACQRRAPRERGDAFAVVDDEDETQAIVEEGTLNALYDDKIDYVRYVEELSSSEKTQQHEWQRWRVGLEAEELLRKPPLYST